MVCPDGERFPHNKPTRMKWLHLEKATTCLGYLVDIVKVCPFLDEDYKTLALRLLETECPKHEKKFSNGKRAGYYIEPGTVLRYDGRYSHDLTRGEKSVLFCSAPYLNLEKPRGSSEDHETNGEHIHRTRTLLESLYDFDLMNERDGQQVVRKNDAAAEDAIICVPQVWYLLCGSVLISCGQASLAELRGDSIQEKYQSHKNLIAHVTDLDNHHFTVALKITDSYFTVIQIIELLRSNLGGDPINNYDIELEGGEFLTPKAWLEIVKRDPLPSLKLTLKSRSSTINTCLALIVRPKTGKSSENIPSESIHDDSNDDEGLNVPQEFGDEYFSLGDDSKEKPDSHSDTPDFNSSNGLELMSLRKSNPARGDARDYPSRQKLLTYNDPDNLALQTTTYPLNSFTGALVKRDEFLSSQQTERDSRGSEETNDRSDATLVDSLAMRYENDAGQMSTLNSNGIVVNDPASLQAAPDVFKLDASSHQDKSGFFEYGTPNVFDFLDPEDDNSSNVSGSGHEKSGISRSEASDKRDTDSVNYEPDRSKSTDSLPTVEKHRPKDEDDSRSVPFLQWRYIDSMGSTFDSGDVVRRVLDQINEQLWRSEGFKKYQKTPECNIEKLHEALTLIPQDTGESGIPDKILDYRKKSLSELKPKLFGSVRALIEMFIPINFEHDVTRKIWGGIHHTWLYMDNIDVSKLQPRGSGYHVQNYKEDRELWLAMGMDSPSRPFESCQGCSRGFNTFNEGIMHLKAVHFDAKYAHPDQPTEESLGLYLRTAQQIQAEARINILASLIEHIDSIFNDLHERAKQLQLGARKPETSDDKNGYPVNGKLVRAFENVAFLIAIMAFEVSKVSRLMKQNEKNVLDIQSLLGRPRRSLDQVNAMIQKHLQNAKIDMITTSRTDSLSGGVTLSSIGPEFMIAVMSSGMFLRQLKDAAGSAGSAIDTCEVYKNYTTSLQFQVNQRPQRRSFADMYALEEELDMLRRVISWQRKFCNNLTRVLDPTSYKTTTKGRISHFRLEGPYILRTLMRLEAKDMELKALQHRTRNLREQLKQSIEILEESHGKAIRVFTLVTVFFLPLSFVTSFMGMNTTDIRDIDKDQAIFWIVALPTTAVVMGLAFMYGYKWDTWKEEFVRWRKMRQPRGFAVDTATGRQGALPRLSPRLFSVLRWRGARFGDVESGVERRETDMTNSSDRLGEKRVRFWGSGKHAWD